jgi:hypothetical protein
LRETDSVFLGQPQRDSHGLDSPSQQSLGTLPVASSLEETVPIFEDHLDAYRLNRRNHWGPVAVIVVLGALATAAVALATVILARM